MQYFAHTMEGKGPADWQRLNDHLEAVATIAAEFASRFNATEWGRMAGLIHDFGKHKPAFQKKLIENSSAYVDHKGVGARLLDELGSGFGKIVAYAVAGHHGGLPDAFGGSKKSLQAIVKDADSLSENIENPLNGYPQPQLPFTPTSFFQCSFFTRMLFSALVDADFLDTEKFMDPEKSTWRTPGPKLQALSEALDRHLKTFSTKGRINSLRAGILAHCRDKATLEPGLFTLTVPTGGGKTLTSMAFALDHAKKHDLERIIYVIPYTSIIEQNAGVFRKIFPDGTVIEHQSNFDPDKPDRNSNADGDAAFANPHQLACENWDAPVVVTTNVQFFESLFGNKTSKCRKLHNLAKSVIILDEAQMLPVEYLVPCMRALEELARNYGSSVMLCTATQPALNHCEDFTQGLKGLTPERELAPDPNRMHREFARTHLKNIGTKTLNDVADMIGKREQVLCIVNTRNRASELFARVRTHAGTYHLSAVMCPVHRSEVLDDIRSDLAEGKPCRVVSTQLIEAGVDVSFPEVIREMAGLDSVTQAAGRCNREGESECLGPVYLFTPAEGLAPAFKQLAGCTESTLRQPEGKDPFSPEAILSFFKMAYWLRADELDRHGIMKRLEDPRGEWQFREAANKFKLIRNTMIPIIIPFDDNAKNHVQSLHFAKFRGSILRKLQQYTVQICDQHFKALNATGAVEIVHDRYAVLVDMSHYDKTMGLTMPSNEPNPEAFIC